MWAAWIVKRREDPTSLCERSLADLREVERVLPEWGLPWLEEAQTLMVLALYEGTANAEVRISNSVRCVSEAIRRMPKSDAAWAFRAQTKESLAYARQGRKEDPIPLLADAEKDWSRALALAPPSAERLLARGRARLGWASYLVVQRRPDPELFERAISDFAKAVEFDPGYSKAWQFLGSSRETSADLMMPRRLQSEARTRYAAAAEAYTKDLESKEPGPESRWRRGRCRMMAEDYRGALDDLEKALAADASLESKLRPWIEKCRSSSKGE